MNVNRKTFIYCSNSIYFIVQNYNYLNYCSSSLSNIEFTNSAYLQNKQF